MKIIASVSMLLMAAAWCAPAQEPGAAEQKLKAELEHALVTAKVLSVEGSVMGTAVKGAPYTAREVTETNQVLADGTRIHNDHQTSVYRDGMGRIRRETGNEVLIMDPVSGVRYTLHTAEHTATKLPMAVSQGSQGQTIAIQKHFLMTGAGSVSGGPNVVFAQTFGNEGVNIGYKAVARGGNVEDLGTDSIEGVVAQGNRTTQTIETGAIGNDRPINIVNERWVSPDLQTLVMSKQSDPREGETIFKLTNIQRGEPDPSLFQLPAGYQVNELSLPPLPARRE